MKNVLNVFLAMAVFFVLVGCNGGKAEEEAKQAAQNMENIMAALETGSIEIKGVCHQVIGSSGSANNSYQTFVGAFKNIKNVMLEESAANIVYAFFIADIENDYYRITESLGIQVTLEKLEDGGFTFVSANVTDDTVPFVEPTIPFDLDYVYEKDGIIQFIVPESVFTEEKYLFNESVTAEYWSWRWYHALTSEHTYCINVPATQENIAEIELLPQNGDVAIAGTPFEIWGMFRITLENGVVVEYGAQIKYRPGKNKEANAEYWEINFPNGVQIDEEYW